ncbi:MAG TPA: AAA family ATPase [Gemmatimonadales bacterium]|nr:AAA family ATPase [Gemmatimonadales bacterium]
MTDALRDLFFGGGQRRELVEGVVPRRTFDDVVLPAGTRRQLAYALSLIQHYDLIYERWGLAERHRGGRGLAFHFAGPPGTGKTICAEAIAHALDRRLLVVRYSEMESMWAGQTAKHIVDVFRAAEREGAVLFFDEADAIAGRRFASVERGYEREANAVVNVLLHELEDFAGVAIFATNLAANIDPAFERRILTHILFEMPDAPERERIWRAQLHPTKTPLADDVDFAVLAERYPASGGDIRNAVLKAAQIAAAQPGPDDRKRIHQEHFVQGIEEVLRAGDVMEQSLYAPRDGGRDDGRDELDPRAAAAQLQAHLLGEQETTRGELARLGTRLDGMDRLLDQLIRQADAAQAATAARGPELVRLAEAAARDRRLLLTGAALALVLAVAALVLALTR